MDCKWAEEQPCEAVVLMASPALAAVSLAGSFVCRPVGWSEQMPQIGVPAPLAGQPIEEGNRVGNSPSPSRSSTHLGDISSVPGTATDPAVSRPDSCALEGHHLFAERIFICYAFRGELIRSPSDAHSDNHPFRLRHGGTTSVTWAWAPRVRNRADSGGRPGLSGHPFFTWEGHQMSSLLTQPQSTHTHTSVDTLYVTPVETQVELSEYSLSLTHTHTPSASLAGSISRCPSPQPRPVGGVCLVTSASVRCVLLLARRRVGSSSVTAPLRCSACLRRPVAGRPVAKSHDNPVAGAVGSRVLPLYTFRGWALHDNSAHQHKSAGRCRVCTFTTQQSHKTHLSRLCLDNTHTHTHTHAMRLCSEKVKVKRYRLQPEPMGCSNRVTRRQLVDPISRHDTVRRSNEPYNSGRHCLLAVLAVGGERRSLSGLGDNFAPPLCLQPGQPRASIAVLPGCTRLLLLSRIPHRHAQRLLCRLVTGAALGRSSGRNGRHVT
ncbi:unnamed protein product [Protopolystoma xenopodis]|uniref:Uncharacterized protein n=1 Tax=Protopolystoma xenopodis TaxID=117903 RepID=A0A448XRS9_9PLAT|nr:unnamed protein product [Protopolystoma xenopodis]